MDAGFSIPKGLVVDASGNLFIVQQENHRIRRVDATGVIITFAGDGSGNFSGDDGQATNAGLRRPTRVALDAGGNLYIADARNHGIRRVDVATGVIITVAGNGVGGFSGDFVSATTANLDSPRGVAVDGKGNLYIADRNNQRIRKVTVGFDGKVDGDSDEIITTVAGNGNAGFTGDGVPANSTSLNSPRGVAVDSSDNLYVADRNNNRVRRVDSARPTPNPAASKWEPTRRITSLAIHR